jgi:hypothetical protein
LRTNNGLNVLLLVHAASESIGAVAQHVDGLTNIGQHKVVKVDSAVADLVDFGAFDVIALHYSIVIVSPNYISPRLYEKIARFRGLKVLFIQDEYRWIDATAAAIRNLGIEVVFSLVHPSVVRKVYHHSFLSSVRFEHTLTGFVAGELVRRSVPRYEQRPLDVGYRARKLVAWYGHHTLQKWQIADKFLSDAARLGLNVDISTREEDRIYGAAWIRFLANARASLGTESGASVLDYSGAIQKNVEAYLVRRPQASFEELRDRFFREQDGKVMMNVISPRCFEAAALRTLMIMYPGEYGGILEPHRHYVVLQPDHSNIEEVIEVLRTPSLAKPIIDRAYQEIASSDKWSFAALGRHFERVVSEEGAVCRVRILTPWTIQKAKWHSTIAYRKQIARYFLAVNAVRAEAALLSVAERVLPSPAFQKLGILMRKCRTRARRIILGA